MLIIESNMALELLMDALTGIKHGVMTNIDIDMVVERFAGVMPSFKFVMPGPLEEFRC